MPEKKGRIYYECDIDYDGGYRGGKRIVYSNDGLIYYTEDHYNSFELLYTSEGKADCEPVAIVCYLPNEEQESSYIDRVCQTIKDAEKDNDCLAVFFVRTV